MLSRFATFRRHCRESGVINYYYYFHFMKPLGRKSYGSIPHLLGSKLGEGDHHCHEGQHKIATEKTRDRHDFIIVQEKYDGSNVAVAKVDSEIIALVRRGYTAESSPFRQHHIFAQWVKKNEILFQAMIDPGNRLCGEWLLQAHGLKYAIQDGLAPFVAFDYFNGDKRLVYSELLEKLNQFDITGPRLICAANSPLSIDFGLNVLFNDHDHPIKTIEGLPEGLIYRVERKGKVDFIAKYVRNDFEPGRYLPEVSGNPEVFNC